MTTSTDTHTHTHTHTHTPPAPTFRRRRLWEDHGFPPILDRLLSTEDAVAARQRVCSELRGDIVEIGFGTGLNLAHLPPAVTRVRVVEPSPGSLRRARPRIDARGIPVEVWGLDGEALPFPDDSVEHVLLTWSLCTIPDPVAAVREVRRILQPGGTLHFVEHGRSPDPKVVRWQQRVNPLWRRFACGCHLDRDVEAMLTAGGLPPQQLEARVIPGEPAIVADSYEGRSTKEVVAP